MVATELVAGSVFAGYVIERRLGAGGMGTVYLARHRALDMPVALKLMTPMVTGTAGSAQFRREAQLVANLQHPNIVDVKDFGDADGTLWMAMQYVPGGDLADLIEDHPHGIDPGRAVRMVAAVADALDYAHANQVIHRDVKPANIFRTTGTAGADWILIGDFGIARSLATEETRTATGHWAFSQPYAPPEQCVGRTVGPPADVHALAVTLYQLTTGHLPHEIPIPATDPALPGTLGQVLAKATAWQPADRHPSCGEMATAAAHALREPNHPDPSGGTAAAAPAVSADVSPASAPGPSSAAKSVGAQRPNAVGRLDERLADDDATVVSAEPPAADTAGAGDTGAAGHADSDIAYLPQPNVAGQQLNSAALPRPSNGGLSAAERAEAEEAGAAARAGNGAADATRTRINDETADSGDWSRDGEADIEHPGPGTGSTIGRSGRSSWGRAVVIGVVGAVAGAAVIAGVVHWNSGSEARPGVTSPPPSITARCMYVATVAVGPGLHAVVPATGDGGRRCLLSTKDAAQGPLTGVKTLQAALRACYSAEIKDAEGVFGADTKRAVLGAQERHAVTRDGVFGPQTSAVMTWPVSGDDGSTRSPCRAIGM
ncbi:serine/threonine-protein kinase [Nocardia tengchongensis]